MGLRPIFNIHYILARKNFLASSLGVLYAWINTEFNESAFV